MLNSSQEHCSSCCSCKCSQGLLADGASGLLGEPPVHTVAVELVFAGQAAQHLSRHQLLQTDGAPALLVRAQASWPHNARWKVLNLLRAGTCTKRRDIQTLVLDPWLPKIRAAHFHSLEANIKEIALQIWRPETNITPLRLSTASSRARRAS